MRAPSETTSYALAPLQQGMLSHHPGHSATGVDLVQLILELPEIIDVAAFRSAWEWVAGRHSILRTQFPPPAPGAEPQQEVVDSVNVDFTSLVWSEASPLAREVRWSELLERDRARGFELAQAPLWRVTTVQLGPQLHRVLFSFHHLLIDARSLLVLLPELFAAHADFAAGRTPSGAPAVPYRRYIDWLGAQDAAGSAAFWREKLAGFRTPTPLPASLSPKAGVEATASDRTLKLSARETESLQAFARTRGVTMNTLIQGAWAALLSRCSGESDVVFGAVRACRHGSTADAAQIVGPLINTLPVRVTLPADASVVDWLRDLRQQWVDLRAHEHVALSSIREWSEVPAGTALFDSVVSYQEPSWDAALAARGGAWAHRRFAVRNQVNHPLALDAAGGPELQLRLSYDASRFSPGAVDRMLGHLATLLHGFVSQPLGRLSELPMLTSAEEDQLLHTWSRGVTTPFPAACIHHQFSRQAVATPDALAVADPHNQLDYAALERRSSALAEALRAQGAGENTFIGVCLEPSVEMVVAFLGVLKAGAAYVPMDPTYPEERLAFIVRDAGVCRVITQRTLAPLFEGVDVPRSFIEEAPALPQETAAPVLRGSPNDLAYLIYTSGSTGTPKGVPIRHRHASNLIAWHQQTYAVTPADRATQIASPAFDACVWELWPYLTRGASIHIPDRETRISPPRLLRWLVDFEITLCFLPTPLAEALLDEEWPAPSTLRAILTGGDRLRRFPGRRLPCALLNHYGPTENTVVSTWGLVPTESDAHALPSIGRPIAHVEALVLDAHRRLVPIGVPGELYLGGLGLSDGYHGQPALTAEKFIAHPFRTGRHERLYRTGDLVRWREDGELEYLGRLDQQVKIRGHRIEPGEIETLLNRQPGVRESLVLAREDATGQPQLVAYLLTHADRVAPDTTELLELLHRQLPAYMVPAVFVTLEAWPLTPNGKIDRRALPAAAAASTGVTKQMPRAGTEAAIARVWAEVLGRDDIGAHDDFFLLGGHSLRASQVITRLNAALPVALTLRHLFEYSTIAGLAAVIDQHAPAASEPVPASALAN